MNKRPLFEHFLSVIIIILGILATNPFSKSMPSMLEMVLVISLAIGVIIFATLIWREKAKDEREQYHRMMADRAGFIAGSLFLAFVALWQAINHQTRYEIIWALIIMAIVKLLALRKADTDS